MLFTIQKIDFHVLPMRTRLPFKYGIASLSSLPHVFVQIELVVNGKVVRGLTSEGLAPKWFTKNPTSLLEEDVAEMLSVIKNAARVGQNAAERSVTFFDWWRSLYDEQASWAKVRELPPLLSNLGVSVMEKAVLDALCKAVGQPLHRLIGDESLGIDLGAVRGELKGMTVNQVIVPEPFRRVHVRQTVGLGDPLRVSDIPADERLHDGLPQALEELIRAYGLTYFKLKVAGKQEHDLARLREIAAVLTENCKEGFHCTLDGNEQFSTLESFREFYDVLASDAALKPLFASLIMIEQPIYRGHALEDAVGPAFANWRNGPAMIIDESDGSLDDLPRALSLGYSGTSHKNCKGIMKGLANAALLKKRQLPYLSGEDLAGIGPVAMIQDMAVVAMLGITHVERNGHYYFKGLSMYPKALQEEVLAVHGDFYIRHADGYPVANIQRGMIEVTSINQAPFGCGATLDMNDYEPLNAWIKRGGIGEL